MGTKTLRTPIRIVLYREDNMWIAHCLEFDLCGHGESRERAVEMLSEAIMTQIDFVLLGDGAVSGLFTPAEGKYFEMFAASKCRLTGELKIQVDAAGIEIESVDARYTDERDVNSSVLVCV